jgi:hypothetical protein
MTAPWIKSASEPQRVGNEANSPPEAQTLPFNSRSLGVSTGSFVARLANLVRVRKSESSQAQLVSVTSDQTKHRPECPLVAHRDILQRRAILNAFGGEADISL